MIRNSAKALIVKDGRVLLNEAGTPRVGTYYALPGGGQRQYETLQEAVARECLEETGLTVRVGDLAVLCEDIIEDGAYRERYPNHAHIVYFVFACEIDETAERQKPSELDTHQTRTRWLTMEELAECAMFEPPELKRKLLGALEGKALEFAGSFRREVRL